LFGLEYKILKKNMYKEITINVFFDKFNLFVYYFKILIIVEIVTGGNSRIK